MCQNRLLEVGDQGDSEISSICLKYIEAKLKVQRTPHLTIIFLWFGLPRLNYSGPAMSETIALDATCNNLRVAPEPWIMISRFVETARIPPEFVRMQKSLGGIGRAIT